MDKKFAALSAIQIHGKKHCQNDFVLILVQNLNMLSVISTIWYNGQTIRSALGNSNSW
jgi:hypothetical protein